ncbi:MAG: hypothetical protein AB1405_10400 [Bdellovibrionota bacterium]
MARDLLGTQGAPPFSERFHGHHDGLTRRLEAFERVLPTSGEVAEFHAALEGYVAFHDSDIHPTFVKSGAASQTVATAFVHALRVMLASARLFGRTWSAAEPQGNPGQFRKELAWAKADLEKQRTVIEHRLRSLEGAASQRFKGAHPPAPSFLVEAE